MSNGTAREQNVQSTYLADQKPAGIILALSEAKEDIHVRYTWMAATALIALFVIPSVATAQDKAQIAKGQQVFTDNKCSVCHSVAGQGNKKGPLDGVGAKLSADDIRQWITNPTEMAAKAKAERKPPMKPVTLPKDELDSLVAYVQSLKK